MSEEEASVNLNALNVWFHGEKQNVKKTLEFEL